MQIVARNVQTGNVVEFYYPSKNHRGAEGPAEPRRAMILSTRDTFEDRIDPHTMEIAPEHGIFGNRRSVRFTTMPCPP